VTRQSQTARVVSSLDICVQDTRISCVSRKQVVLNQSAISALNIEVIHELAVHEQHLEELLVSLKIESSDSEALKATLEKVGNYDMQSQKWSLRKDLGRNWTSSHTGIGGKRIVRKRLKI